MGGCSTTSMHPCARLEPLEQRQLMAISEIQDLTVDPASNGRPAFTFVVSNGIGFFTRWGAVSVGSLWRTDGVTATRLGGGPPGIFRDLMAVDAGVVGMQDGVPSKIWRSDGTVAGTFVVGPVNGVHSTLFGFTLRGHFYLNDDNFNAGIYETDGTTLWFRGRALGVFGDGAEYSDGIVLRSFVTPNSSGLYTLNSGGVLTRFIDQPALGGFPDQPFN